MSKDYYRTLGVLDDAEDIVIRAAYRALSQRYHPDKCAGNKEEANLRMTEINEAYGILSDPIKRKEYDSLRRNEAGAENDYYDDTTQEFDSNSDSFEADWQVACGVYPELNQIVSGLKKVSFRLANTYRIYMLESKSFLKRKEVSEKMEDAFLSGYFGNKPKIKLFAKNLIYQGRRNAALALNKLIKIIGDSDPDRLILRIQDDYLAPEEERIREEVRQRAYAKYKGQARSCEIYECRKCHFLGELILGKKEGFFKGRYQVICPNCGDFTTEFIDVSGRTDNELTCNNCGIKGKMYLKIRKLNVVECLVLLVLGGFPASILFMFSEPFLQSKNHLLVLVLYLLSYAGCYFIFFRNKIIQCPNCKNIGPIDK